jgi:hypothetical protein
MYISHQLHQLQRLASREIYCTSFDFEKKQFIKRAEYSARFFYWLGSGE